MPIASRTTEELIAEAWRSHVAVRGIDRPGLVPALLVLSEEQRSAVWLVHARGWLHADVAPGIAPASS
ncbi:MAG: hypothetical protein OEY41_03535 [Acidimicrobiia bacterium]|nr:hypothetical protein [Acidimicrobiia bacterium]MDH5289053.1 hypothetical protein [Acidimicrobiia bacterium]